MSEEQIRQELLAIRGQVADEAAETRASIAALRHEVMKIVRDGCALAGDHRTHNERILSLERSHAELKGKTVLAGSAIAILASAAFAWIGRKI